MFSFHIERSKERTWLYMLMLIVLLISSAIVLTKGHYFLLGDLDKPNNDDVKYIHSAKLLINEGVLAYNSGNEPSTFIMPLFPIMLAGFMKVFGQGDAAIIAFRLFQCLQQAASLYFIFIIARYMFNSRAAIIACVISALYWPDYFSSGVILTESTFRLVILALIAVSIAAVQRKRAGWYLGVGVLVALAAYFKPHASLFPAIFLILWWKEKYSLKQMITSMLYIGAAYVVCLMPWWIRNWLTFHQLIIFTTSGGSPFLLGTRIDWNLPSADFFKLYPEYDPKTIFEGSDSVAIQKGIDILKYGFTYEPLKYLHWYTIGKFYNLYMIPYYWRPIWPFGKSLMFAIQYGFMLVALAGMVWAMIRESFARLMPVLLTLAYFTVIYMPFVAFSRYGYPNMVLFIMFAAYLLDQLLYFTKNRSLSKRTVRM